MILKKKLLIAIVVFALSFIFIFEKNDSFAEERIDNATWLEKKISVECGSRPLLEILQEISESLEVEIIFDANLATTAINCSYTDSTVESIIKRIFKDYNKGILIDLDTRTITVQIFGVSKYILASTERSGEILYLPFLGNMSNEELAEMQALQVQEYQKRLNDDQDIVPGVNVTRGDLRSLHNKQHKEYQEQLNDPDAIVPGVGITRGELKILHEQQQKDYQQKKRNSPQTPSY